MLRYIGPNSQFALNPRLISSGCDPFRAFHQCLVHRLIQALLSLVCTPSCRRPTAAASFGCNDFTPFPDEVLQFVPEPHHAPKEHRLILFFRKLHNRDEQAAVACADLRGKQRRIDLVEFRSFIINNESEKLTSRIVENFSAGLYVLVAFAAALTNPVNPDQLVKPATAAAAPEVADIPLTVGLPAVEMP